MQPFPFFKNLSLFCLGLLPLYAEISTEEGLSLKRIEEFWKDKDFDGAKVQIVNFLKSYKNSEAHSQLYAILGDLYLKDGHHDKAVQIYGKIIDQSFMEKTLYNKVYCLFKLKNYASISEIAQNYLTQNPLREIEDSLRFMFAESLLATAIENPQNQKDLALKAKEQYQNLVNSSYQKSALFALAEIAKITENYEEAAKRYQDLAETYISKKSDFLFQAAIAQSNFDKSIAAETFKKVIEEGKENISIAAFNRLLLLFQSDRFQDIVDDYKKVQTFPEDKKGQSLFYVGMSLYNLKNYEEASSIFQKVLQIAYPTNFENEYKTTLSCLMNSAYMLKDLKLFSSTLKILKKQFPTDLSIPEALCMQINLAVLLENCELAENGLNDLYYNFQNSPNLEKLIYDYALLLDKKSDFDKERKVLIALQKKFPESSLFDQSAANLINTSLKRISNATQEELSLKKMDLISDLTAILEHKNLANESSYRFLLGKTFYEYGILKEAIANLENYLTNNDNSNHSLDARLMLCFCYLKDNLIAPFVEQAEKLLKDYPDILEATQLHLNLFNAYVILGEQGSNPNWEEKASFHLFSCYQSNPSSISKENLLWLANYYYDKDSEKALTLFKEILVKDGKLSISENSTFLEYEVLKLSDLLDKLGATTDRIVLLEGLSSLQTSNPSFKWETNKKVLLDLARIYSSSEQKEMAVKVYDQILSSFKPGSSQRDFASLERAKLVFSILKDSEKNNSSPQVVSILKDLKDLQIQKKLSLEPIYIDAALEYVCIQTSLSNKDVRLDRSIFLLNRLIEDFTSEDNPITKIYLSKREEFSEKAKLIDSYLMVLNKQLKLLEIALTEKQDPEGAKIAKEKIENITIDDISLMKNIEERIARSLSYGS